MSRENRQPKNGIRRLSRFVGAGALSGAVDVGVFALLFGVVLQTPSLTLKTLIATVVARVLSSLVNFVCNYAFVFGGTQKRSVVRYYVLLLFQLAASFAIARVWAGLTHSEFAVSVLKALSDMGLALLSYQIQRRWVFADHTPPRRFYGELAGFAKALFNVLRKHYDASAITFPEEGRVYICRHLNMHGCYTVVRSLDFDVHTFAYHMFFTFKEAFCQYSQITFAKNGKATWGSKLKALLPALLVPPLLRSARAIPVYRNSLRSCITIKQAGRYLLKNECILLFPDVDYKAAQEVESEIYKGFLLLEKLYYRHYHTHLKFVPLYIADDEKRVYELPPVTFEDGDFKTQLDTVAEKIRFSIQHNAPAPADEKTTVNE